MASVEIERKFLVSGSLPFSLHELPYDEILQGYLALEPNGKEVRLRKKGDRHLLTIKGPGTIARQETEIVILEDQFTSLWPWTSGRRLEKKRYRFWNAPHWIEIDEYLGALTGLIIAEVEFTSKEASQEFTPLPWMDQEVTDFASFKNRALVLKVAQQNQKTNEHE